MSMNGEGAPNNQTPLNTVLQGLEAGGFAPKRVGDSYEARCPAHKDDRPSLSVKEGVDGRALLNCHAGCEVTNVVSALGLAMKDLFAAAPAPSRPSKSYRYVDEQGALLFEAVRFEPKTFRQRRPVPGGWEWNLGTTRRVLYRLPALVEAVKTGATIYLVEGEKDADNLSALGVVATTNPMGAGKWRLEYTGQLRGAARVVILPDKDEPGRKHAQQVVKAITGMVSEVKVLELPGPGKDASDWIAAGGTRQQLEQLLVAAAPPGDAPGPEFSKKTETALAEMFVNRCGEDLRYCGQWGKWLVWDGACWGYDITGHAQRLLKGVLRGELMAAEQVNDAEALKSILAAESRSRRENILQLARYELPVQVEPGALDADPMLLGCRNGIIDLRTGKLGPHRREALLSKKSPAQYGEAARCPTWLAFLRRIFDGNEELISFLQRAVGYSLTGSVAEQCMFVLWGTGANGKSTFLLTLLAMLGEYGRSGVQDLLVAKSHEQHPTELADLFGARFVAFQETQEGQRFDESKVKALTGGDKIKARRMKEDFWEFTPTHKLWLGTNHRPNIRGTDLAIWRRIRLIPFSVTIPEGERDGKLPEKLAAELPGILRWAVDGCLAWQREGLRPPKEVTEAVAEYRKTEDRISAFLEERCVVRTGVQVASGELYAAYRIWAEAGGEHVLSNIVFGRRLGDLGFGSDLFGKQNKRTWFGIGLKTDREDEPPPSSSPKQGEWYGNA